MERLQRAAVILMLAKRLREAGSWCGETHVQKAAYFLENMLDVPLEHTFVLYKFGPYSFDLKDDFAYFQANGFVKFETQNYPYGPRLVLTEASESVFRRYPSLLGQYEDQIAFVTRHLGQKGVADLEKLSTALYVTLEMGRSVEDSCRAEKLNELKPHVTVESALTAVREVDSLFREAKAVQHRGLTGSAQPR